jgi:DNA-binding PadR family transcriptional regulator
MYGVQIGEAIEEASNYSITMSPPKLYPALRKLENKGLIISEKENRDRGVRRGNKRVYYTITKNGDSCLRDLNMFRDNLRSPRVAF